MVIDNLANEIMERVREIEPTVTADLEEAASLRDARLVDLAFRFKTRESIVRKMGLVKTYNPDIPEGRLKGLIRDALRYTMVCEAQSYSQVVSDVLANLRERGYEFEEKDVKNYWPEYEVYKGINVSLRLGEDMLELQFHTDESWEAKNKAHPLYEESRLQDTPPTRREELERRMIAVFGRIRTPPGVEDIGRVVDE